MTGRSVAELVLGGVVVLFVLSLVAGQVLGQPVLLGYVQTESMSPTLEPGDGFVAVPAAVSGPVEPGDVVVFEASVIDGGGLTTHRVVGERDGGFLTRGDDNVVTDQDSGEPPVRRERIVAEALQVGGHVVAIPGIGLVAGAVRGLLDGVRSVVGAIVGGAGGVGSQSIAYVLFAAGVVAYLWSEYAARSSEGPAARDRSRDDDAVDARTVVLSIAVLAGAVLTGSMLLAETTHEFGVVSAEQDSSRPYVIEQGGTENVTYRVPSYGVLPAVVFLEPDTDRVSAQPRELYVPGSGTANATIGLTAPPETGHYPQYLTERRYPGVLPVGATRTLYRIHPVLPMVVIDLLVGGGLAGLGWALFGNQRIRLASRSPQRPLRYRLRRWLR